ncbi:MAG: DUF86 domain-containing protein [Rhizobiales bacterium]|nr:DUF86 domain-containing protein [Hyphomicrobiales bacterium]
MPFDAEVSALRDSSRHIELAQRFVAGVDYSEFQSDLMRLYAVVRRLEVISEASRRLSSELKSRHPGIPWRNIAGAGNVYRHSYEDVAAKMVWETLQSALPELQAAVALELHRGTSAR